MNRRSEKGLFAGWEQEESRILSAEFGVMQLIRNHNYARSAIPVGTLRDYHDSASASIYKAMR